MKNGCFGSHFFCIILSGVFLSFRYACRVIPMSRYRLLAFICQGSRQNWRAFCRYTKKVHPEGCTF